MMSKPITTNPAEERDHSSLNIPLGQICVSKEAQAALDAAGITLDDVLREHASGHGGDADYDHCLDNYTGVKAGGPNCSAHDLDDDEAAQLAVVTTPDREVTIVWLHMEAD